MKPKTLEPPPIQLQDNKAPMVVKTGIFGTQVCVPASWGDIKVSKWLNKTNPAGTENGWMMKHTGEASLSGCPERVECKRRAGFVHIMFQC